MLLQLYFVGWLFSAVVLSAVEIHSRDVKKEDAGECVMKNCGWALIWPIIWLLVAVMFLTGVVVTAWKQFKGVEGK